MRSFTTYLFIALLTFGYSAAEARCNPDLIRHPEGSFCKITVGMASGIAWPLYWVWTAFDLALHEQIGGYNADR